MSQRRSSCHRALERRGALAEDFERLVIFFAHNSAPTVISVPRFIAGDKVESLSRSNRTRLKRRSPDNGGRRGFLGSVMGEPLGRTREVRHG